MTLRGLAPGDWVIEDYVEGRPLGTVNASNPTLSVSFKNNLLILARQVA